MYFQKRIDFYVVGQGYTVPLFVLLLTFYPFGGVAYMVYQEGAGEAGSLPGIVRLILNMYFQVDRSCWMGYTEGR